MAGKLSNMKILQSKTDGLNINVAKPAILVRDRLSKRRPQNKKPVFLFLFTLY